MNVLKIIRTGLISCPVLILVLLMFSPAVHGQDVRTYIPKNAYALFPLVGSEQNRLFPEAPITFYVDSLIEQESCISLTHSRCWSATSELKTSREQGVGLLQITRAYTATGSLRFDTLGDLRRKYMVELKDLGWDNIKQRPDLQIRAGILLIKDNYNALRSVPNPYDRLAMADSAYNGGMGNLNKSRKACGLAKNCDPNLWFGNVENYLVQSRAALYGQRSAYDINKEHVTNTMSLRLWKYRPYTY